MLNNNSNIFCNIEGICLTITPNLVIQPNVKEVVDTQNLSLLSNINTQIATLLKSNTNIIEKISSEKFKEVIKSLPQQLSETQITDLNILVTLLDQRDRIQLVESFAMPDYGFMLFKK